MEGAGEWCSLRERDAAAIERAADDVARAFLLERAAVPRAAGTRSSTGEVIGVIGAGAFVAFGDGFEGLLPVRRLRGDWWELDPLEVMLVGSQSGKAIRLGDPVTRAGGARRRAARPRRPLPRRVVSSAMPDIATNKQAAYRYHLLEKWEAGLVLTGTEVKSLRGGKAQLKDGYASVQNGEVWLHNVHIPPYGPATRENHEPERPRKLLLHKREIERLIGKTREKGLTIVPTRALLQGPAGQGRGRARPRQGRRRQAPDDQGAGDEARDGAGDPPPLGRRRRGHHEAAGADLLAVAALGARALAGPHDPAVPAGLQAISLAGEAPGGGELQLGGGRPAAEDLLAVALELDVVVARAADRRPAQQRRRAQLLAARRARAAAGPGTTCSVRLALVAGRVGQRDLVRVRPAVLDAPVDQRAAGLADQHGLRRAAHAGGADDPGG